MNHTVTLDFPSVNNVRYDVVVPSKGANSMSKVCKALFPLWLFGAFPVAFVTLLCLSWDHRFGHPPVGEWIFAACYALLGLAMFVTANRTKPAATAS